MEKEVRHSDVLCIRPIWINFHQTVKQMTCRQAAIIIEQRQPIAMKDYLLMVDERDVVDFRLGLQVDAVFYSAQ
jgi:hypothetical protein